MSQQKSPYMIFRVGGRMCAVSVSNVVEVSVSDSINPLPGAPSYVIGIKKFRNEIVPIIDTVKMLSIPKAQSDDVPNKYAVMFEINTANGKKKFGALIDKVLNVVDLNNADIKKLELTDDSLAGASYVKGILMSNNGNFVYVLLPELFFSKQDILKITKIIPDENSNMEYNI